jgi:sugar O-acyltransferase (sialic acid O-acetyltransferase NeuD family)
MNPLLLLGGGGHCRACIDVIESAGGFQIAGIVQRAPDGVQPVLGYPVLGDDDELESLLRRFPNALVTVGQIKSPGIRIKLFALLRSLDAHLPVIVSPKAHVSRHAQVQDGSIVMHGAIVNAGARVAENCIVNSQALVEHDAIVEAHCHISTGARVNGGALIGSGSFVGSGVILHEGVRVGCNCVIGAGRVVRDDVPANTVLRREA